MESTLQPTSVLPAAPQSRHLGHAAPGPRLILPPDFEAFYLLHHDLYQRYALHHLAQADAERVVATTFGDLATRWCHVLTHLAPTAHAWRMFRVHTCLARHRTGGTRGHRTPPTLSALLYDALVLHQHLGYPVAAVADAMGEDLATLRTALRRTDRIGRNR